MGLTGGDALDTALIDKLIDVLNKETSVYEGILKLSRQKTDVIISGKVSELEGITRAEQSVIMTLGKLEEERENLVEQIASQLDMKASDVKLSNLIKMLPKERAEKLKKCHDTLPKVFSDIQDANGVNSKLIRNSLDYIDFSINVLTSTGTIGNYGNSGLSDDPKKKNFFDLKL
jgi:flagellar biosynthesis/type III secretory pathway chaperone